ncbi:hypothetical protein [Geodermatophilus sp. SYSU D00710]
MATSFPSAAPSRLARLRGQDAVNAIDFLEVPDYSDTPSSLRRRVLLIKLLNQRGLAGLDRWQVRVTGGVATRDPQVVFAAGLATLTPTNQEWTRITTPVERDHVTNKLRVIYRPISEWLFVLVDRPGDHTRYRLELGQDDRPPAEFDPVLSEVAFFFHVDAESDPLRGDTGTPTPPQEPELDYLARDFASFRRLMFDRLALLAPADVSDDPAELRTTLVEVLAYAADQVAYFQDAVATEAYLGTARTRPSVRRHARLLDYTVHEGCNARAFVQLELAAGVEVVGSALRPGAMFLTRVPARGPVLQPDEWPGTLALGPEVFEALAGPVAFCAAHNAISFHSWAAEDFTVAEGATEAAVVDPQGPDGKGRLRLAPGDFLALEQNGPPDDLDLARRHVVRLVEVGEPLDDPLFPDARVRLVRWHEHDALPFPLPVRAGRLAVAVARGNLVLVDHGRTVAQERLALRPWGHRLRVRLDRPHLTWATAVDPAAPASASLVQDPAAAVPVIEVHGEGETWTPLPDLLDAYEYTRAFVVEPESDGSVQLRFGDGQSGRHPVELDGFAATYRVGNGPSGNVGADGIRHLVAGAAVAAQLSGAVVGVRNPLPAIGGRRAESIDDVKLHAPLALRVRERAVTEADWVEQARTHPDVQNAVAEIRWTGSWPTVYVTPDPVAGAEPDVVRDQLIARLGGRRLAGYGLEVLLPAYVGLDIVLQVRVADGYFADDVHEALRREFSAGPLPGGRLGFFHPDRFTFGTSVWRSQVVTGAMGVPGVAAAQAVRFRRWGLPEAAGDQPLRVAIGPSEIARCDSDPDAVEHGRIEFLLESGR